MKRLVIGLLVVAFAGATARTIAKRKLPELIDHMAEYVMPNIMDSCFAQMSPARRIFMLAHCRGMLDRVEAKHGAPQPMTERTEVS